MKRKEIHNPRGGYPDSRRGFKEDKVAVPKPPPKVEKKTVKKEVKDEKE